MLELRDVRLRRGAAVLFDKANLTVFRGDKIGIVGRNGCGKSSLLALLRGDLGADAGEYKVPGKLNFVSVSQELPRTEATVLEYVRGGDGRLMQIEAALEKARAADDGMKEAELLGDYDSAGGWTSSARAAELADGLGFAPDDIERPVKVLSGGLQMRANMARALMSRADVLMLDEPTNHLDLDAVLWLESWLQRFPGTLLLVSHDREFLDDIVNRVVNLENGQLTHWTGNYTDFQRQHAASIQQSAAMAARQEREVARLHSFIDRFRAQASKARQVQSRIKALSKLETIATYQELENFEWEFAAANKLPQPLVTLDTASAGYGERTVVAGVNRSVNPGRTCGYSGSLDSAWVLLKPASAIHPKRSFARRLLSARMAAQRIRGWNTLRSRRLKNTGICRSIFIVSRKRIRFCPSLRALWRHRQARSSFILKRWPPQVRIRSRPSLRPRNRAGARLRSDTRWNCWRARPTIT